MERELPNLPHEIIFDILCRLPVKPLCRFKSVSKPWLALITNPHFIKSHLNQFTKDNQTQKLILAGRFSESVYSVDYQVPDYPVTELEVPCKSRVRILGSFNGVVLLGIGFELCLGNPSIRIYQKFSQPDYQNGAIMYGLCYDSVSDDFKVIRAIMPFSDAPGAAHLFTSKLGTWKKIGDFGYKIYDLRPGMVLNGMPHWIVKHDTDRVIVYFDATEEKFKELLLPNYVHKDKLIQLGILGGWLCLVQMYQGFEVWVMKKYGLKESWTKLFVVPEVSIVPQQLLCAIFMPLCYSKDGEVVMVFNLEKLVIYNLKENRHASIGIPLDCIYLDVSLYVETLFRQTLFRPMVMAVV